MAGPPKAPDAPAASGSVGADEKFAWRQVYNKPDIAGMSALSRREEEALVKDAKANARHVCRDFVAGVSVTEPYCSGSNASPAYLVILSGHDDRLTPDISAFRQPTQRVSSPGWSAPSGLAALNRRR